MEKNTLLKHYICLSVLVYLLFTGTNSFTSLLFSHCIPTAGTCYKFERLLLEHGLAIECICQDHRGFLWIGTTDGLRRYDGYDFKEYRHDSSDPASLSNNNVHTIFEDREKNLWIGTEDGLNRLDRKHEKFIHFRHDSADPNSISHNEVSCIYEDRSKTLWIGTHEGLNSINTTGPPLSKKIIFNRYKNDPNNPQSLGNDFIRVLHEDRYGFLWIGTDGGGLDRFDKKNNTFIHFKHQQDNPGSISDNHIVALCGDNNGTLWIGTKSGGLNKLLTNDILNAKTTTFYRYKHNPDDPYSLSHNRVWVIIKDSTGAIWVGTRGGGLNQLIYEDSDKNASNSPKFIHYKHDVTDPESMSSNLINAIHEDKSGILWIGTAGTGLNKLNRRKQQFSHFKRPPDESGNQNHNLIYAVHEDHSGTIWLGTYAEGIAAFDIETATFTPYKCRSGHQNEIKQNTVLCIFEDHKQTLWIGTDGGGLGQFDRDSKTFRYFRNQPDNSFSLSDNHVVALHEDHSGMLWIGTDKGLNVMALSGTGDGTADSVGNTPDRTPRFHHYRHNRNNPNGLSSDYVLTIFQDSASKGSSIMVGVYNGGLDILDKEKQQFNHFRHDPANPHSLCNNNVRCIYRDSSDTLWIGTDGGLNKFLEKENTFVHYKESDGLPNNKIYGILEADNGQLWLSTPKGLSKLDSKTNQFKNYDAGDGLQSNKFSPGAYTKTRDGKLIFGGINGINVLARPEHIKNNYSIPPVAITGFRVITDDSATTSDSRNRFPMSITEVERMKLSYQDYYFAFEFAALDFTNPHKNKYAYRMQGLEKDWIYTSAGKRFASYSHLSPGTYTFRVRGSNNDGIWNKKGCSIEITIVPPFWKRWWFQVSVVLFLALMVFTGFQWRTRRLRNQLAEQERIQKLLKQSRDEMEESRDLAEFRSAENEKLISAISSIFIAINNRGRVFQWNSASEEFFGMSEHHVTDRLLVDVLKDHVSIDILKNLVQTGLQCEKSSGNIEIRVDLCRSNQQDCSRLLLANINPIIDRSGKRFGFLLLAEDITNKKKEEMLMALSQKLESLGQMAAGVAHEIRSPLQYIGDNVRFLTEAFAALTEFYVQIKEMVHKATPDKNPDQSHTSGPVDCKIINQWMTDGDLDYYLEEIPKATGQIVNGVNRVSNIVVSMNEFSYPGRGMDESADLNRMIKSTLVVAHNRIKRVADLETDFADNLPLFRGGMGELNQVFLNLLSNAADAVADTGKMGRIKITTRHQTDELVVEISDTGVGIPDEIKTKIFTPFFTTKTVGKGTGQGLPFSYRIVVEKHKGKLYFESKVNEGTTFYIHLPIQGENERAKQQYE